MSYKVGISSGYWSIAKGGGAEASEALAGISKKIYFSQTQGVQFTQIDIESLAEFGEPNLKEKLEAIKKAGFEFGVHAECVAIGMNTLPLDSPLEDDYKRAHERLVLHIKKSGEIGSKYVLLHSSESHPFILLGKELQPTKLVDVWGRPLRKFLEENRRLLDWVVEKDFVWEFTHRTPKGIISEIEENLLNNFYVRNKKEPSEEEKKKIHEEAVRSAEGWFLQKISSADLAYGAERVAYFITAKWMEDSRDPMWANTVGGTIDDDKFREDYQKWVPAVSAKYIWGHFNPKVSVFENPKKLLEKHKMYLVFETPMATAGYELHMRLSRPLHMYYLAKAIGSDLVGLAMDFEHMLGSNLDPKKEVEALPFNGGKFVKVIHAGFPAPYQPAHLPIGVGSDAQLFLYERLYELRKKGFMDGFIIFERGDESSIKQTIISLRLIVQFLEKETPPNKLTPEFFGMAEKGAEVTRQIVAIREHAFDPLKGMLAVPEEEHGFLGRKAVEKGKGEEWRKEKYK